MTNYAVAEAIVNNLINKNMMCSLDRNTATNIVTKMLIDAGAKGKSLENCNSTKPNKKKFYN